MENSSQIAEAVLIENELEVVESRENSVIRASFFTLIGRNNFVSRFS